MQIYIFFLHVSLLHHNYAWCLQGPREIVGFLGIEVADGLRNHMGSENQAGSSRKSNIALNGWAIFPAPCVFVFIIIIESSFS